MLVLIYILTPSNANCFHNGIKLDAATADTVGSAFNKRMQATINALFSFVIKITVKILQ